MVIRKEEVNHLDQLIEEINNLAGMSATHLDGNKYLKLVKNNNISVELKKKDLIESLHSLLTKTLVERHEDKKTLGNNIDIARGLVIKLKDINYYLKEGFLKETKIIDPGNIEEKETYLTSKDMDKLEYNIQELMKKIIFLDESLLDKYEKKTKKSRTDSYKEAHDIKLLLNKQSDLLCHIESKLPPSSIITKKLLEKKNYSHWIVRLFALLIELMESYTKEVDIFKRLKKSKDIQKKYSLKISHLIKERECMLKIANARALALNKVVELDNETEMLAKSLSICMRL